LICFRQYGAVASRSVAQNRLAGSDTSILLGPRLNWHRTRYFRSTESGFDLPPFAKPKV
jgi:hypothetical protein